MRKIIVLQEREMERDAHVTLKQYCSESKATTK
jgi:hypothetical protein